MDTLINIPVCSAQRTPLSPPKDDCNQCDCKMYSPVFESVHSSNWSIMVDCPCVTNDLISRGVIKYEGTTEASGFETERIIREHIRNHPRLPRER